MSLSQGSLISEEDDQMDNLSSVGDVEEKVEAGGAEGGVTTPDPDERELLDPSAEDKVQDKDDQEEQLSPVLASLSSPKVVKVDANKSIDMGTLTPSHWTSEATEAEITSLRQQARILRDQLDRCYEIEADSNDYISVLKTRSRSVDQTMERVREVEEENRRLKRELAYEFDDAVTQKNRIEFLEHKLYLMEEEKDGLTSECAQLRKQRETADKNMVCQERIISQAYRKKLESELKTVEDYYKEELRKSQLCSGCYSRMANPHHCEEMMQPPTMDSRIILMNPSHPAYEQLRATPIEQLRRNQFQFQPAMAPTASSPVPAVKMNETVELTYYAEPLYPVKPKGLALKSFEEKRHGSSGAKIQKPREDAKKEKTSSNNKRVDETSKSSNSRSHSKGSSSVNTKREKDNCAKSETKSESMTVHIEVPNEQEKRRYEGLDQFRKVTIKRMKRSESK